MSMSQQTNGKKPTYRVRWLVSPLHDAHGTSSFVAGLGALANSGVLELALEPLKSTQLEPHVMHLVVEELASGRVQEIAFEVFDRADRFDYVTIRQVDTYFKQTLDRRFLADFPAEFRDRVRPGGLTFSTCVPGTRRMVARSALTSCVAHAQSYGPRATPGAVRRMFKDIFNLSGTLLLSDWERTEADPLRGNVVFQTRLWRPSQDHVVDRNAVNRSRVGVVRALRNAFGSGDQIGLIHSEFAVTEAPDALLTQKVSRKEYARQLRTSLISVNTHGLDGSPGFKIGESLAAGAAIVSQPFHFELPEPLQSGINFLPFESPEECVQQCKRLLEDLDLAERMRSENLLYYQRYVRPEAYVRNLLERAFE
jgi:hypothetical protein